MKTTFTRKELSGYSPLWRRKEDVNLLTFTRSTFFQWVTGRGRVTIQSIIKNKDIHLGTKLELVFDRCSLSRKDKLTMSIALCKEVLPLIDQVENPLESRCLELVSECHFGRKTGTVVEELRSICATLAKMSYSGDGEVTQHVTLAVLYTASQVLLYNCYNGQGLSPVGVSEYTDMVNDGIRCTMEYSDGTEYKDKISSLLLDILK